MEGHGTPHSCLDLWFPRAYGLRLLRLSTEPEAEPGMKRKLWRSHSQVNVPGFLPPGNAGGQSRWHLWEQQPEPTKWCHVEGLT